MPTPAWLADRAGQHAHRVRSEGLATVLSSDRDRMAALMRRYAWRVTHDHRPNATPVFIIGVQRSGTDMIVMSFKECPEVEVHNEAMDTRAFSGFALRDDSIIRGLVESSRHKAVLFKSLLDSHRIVHLMENLGSPSAGKSIWIYRSMEGRVRSTIARWPENNRRVLGEIAAGASRWEAGGLTDHQLDLIREFDYDTMSPESGAALLWYLRNSVFFNLALDRRPDVELVSYEAFLESPNDRMRALCEFVGVTFDPRMIRTVAPRPPATRAALEIDSRIASLCAELYERLERTHEERCLSRAAST